MILKAAFPAAFFAASASLGHAQTFSGAELSIDVFAFSEEGDFGYTTYSGALEYAVNRDISVAVDLSYYDFDFLGDGGSNVTLHGIYHLDDSTSVGAFLGQDSLGDASTLLFGIEGGYEHTNFTVEGYVARYDSDGDASVLGLAGSYIINDDFSVIAEFGMADYTGDSLTRISAGAQYNIAGGPELWAQLGTIEVGGIDDTFIGIGARIEIGADRGTTFGRRGLFDVVPGL